MQIQIQLAFVIAALAALCAVALRPALRAVWREALVLGGYVLLTIAVTGMWRAPTRLFLAGEDPTIETWMLMRVGQNLLHHPLDPYVGNLGYPEAHAVLFSDPLLGLALLVLPLRAFTDNAALLYNVALLLALTLTAYGFYRLALRLCRHPGAAVVAGTFAAFMPLQVHRLYLGSLPYVTLGGFAFLILGLIALLERPRLSVAVGTALAFFLQASIGGYWAMFATLVALIVAAWGWRSFLQPKTWAAALIAAGLAGMLLLPYVTGFLEIRQAAETSRSGHWAEMLALDPGIHPLTSYSYLWRPFLPEPAKPGGRLFPGLLVLTLASFGVARRRDRYTGLLLLLAGVFFVLALGPYLEIAGHRIAPMPLNWLRSHLPLFGSIRTPITFAVISAGALAVLAARGLASLPLARRPWLVALAIVLGVSELLSPPPRLDDRGNPRPDVYAFLAQQPRGGILHVPTTIETYPELRWAAAVHELPMLNIGGFGFSPRWWLDLDRFIRKEWYAKPARQDMQDWRSTAFLRRLPARYLVLRPRVSGYLTSNVEATPGTFTLLGETAAGYRVYRIRRGDSGARFQRLFGDDELRAAPLLAWVRSRPNARLEAELNGRPLPSTPLTADWKRVEWTPDASMIRRGSNELTLSVQPSPAERVASDAPVLELYDIGRADAVARP